VASERERMTDKVEAYAILSPNRQGFLKRFTNRIRGLPPNTCHVAWVLKNPVQLTQGAAVCSVCGAFHGTRPRLTDEAIDSVIRRYR
jgi:hypothetical protein